MLSHQSGNLTLRVVVIMQKKNKVTNERLANCIVWVPGISFESSGPDLNVLQGVDLITPPIAGIRLNFQSDHTSWRNDSIQENIMKSIRAFYVHERVVFKRPFLVENLSQY